MTSQLESRHPIYHVDEGADKRPSETGSCCLDLSLNIDRQTLKGLFNSLLAKSRDPPARVIDIGINFCITESNELPPFKPGKEGFSRHTG